jgi:endonuclease YncB( thermonuclease family)
MKRFMVAILSLFLSMLSALPVTGSMAHPIHIYLDGKKIELDVSPYLEQGNVLVPVMQYGRILHAEVALNEETKTIVVSKNGEQLEFPLGHSLATVNRRTHRMEVPSRLVNGTAFVPLRFLSEAFGCQVGWEGRSQTVVVSCVPKKQVKVKEIADGPILVVDWDGEEKRILLLGLYNMERNTVKHKELIHKTVMNYFKENLENKDVWVELPDEQAKYTSPKYGPSYDLEAIVYDPGGNMVNADLIDRGIMGFVGYFPNHPWYPLFKELDQKAYLRKIGFWQPEYMELLVPQSDYVKIVRADFAEGLVAIKNTDESSNDIGGWTLSNAKGDRLFTFPEGFVLEGLQSVAVLSGNWAYTFMNNHNISFSPAVTLIWTTEPVWNPEGDTAILYDNEGYEISRFP